MVLIDNVLGAANVARSFLSPTRAVDAVAILGQGFAPLFQDARPLIASVDESSQLMEHPLETGAVIADHIVFNPIEIELPLLCVGEQAYRSTYAAIRETFNKATRLTVQTRTSSYPNMIIMEMPHEESPETFDAIAIRLLLREARFVTPKTGLSEDQVADPSQSSTAGRGAQQTTNASASTSSKAGSAAANSGQGAKPQGSTLYRWAYQ